MNFNKWIEKLNKIDLIEASHIVETNKSFTLNERMKLLDYLTDRKIKETNYEKCKHISGLEYISKLEKEETENEI